MGNGVRWSPDDLRDYERRRDAALRDVSLAVAATAAAKPRDPESKLERRFTQQLTDNGITGYQRNYFFLPDRDLELDYAWAPIKLAVEVQGMAHRIKGNFERDIEKRALAMLSGWRVLEVSGTTIRDGRALAWIRQLLGK